MREATINELEEFKKLYCKSPNDRLKMHDDYDIQVESYEELLPGITVKSYATGNRDINNGFIVFTVVDTTNNVVYHPVFSDTVGRELANEWGMKLPSKMTVFVNNNVGNGDANHNNRVSNHIPEKKDDNRKMLILIQFARSMMILHSNEPKPMKEPFKGIYKKLTEHPMYEVRKSDIKSVNTAIKNYLKMSVNTENENFSNLQGYIEYLQIQYPEQHLRNYDFEILRNKMKLQYPNENIVF